MMKCLVRFVLAFSMAILAAPKKVSAFSDHIFSVGVGYASQNIMNRTSHNANGETGFWGEVSYPLVLKYDFSVNMDWFLAPQLSHTLIPRKAAGGTAKVTTTHLALQIGQNITDDRAALWDWYFGSGIIRYEIKGEGGTTVMNNGTSTATFALPGRDSVVQKLAAHVGTSFTYEQSRLGIDFISENLFSQTKRAQSLMFNYMYQFGGGY